MKAKQIDIATRLALRPAEAAKALGIGERRLRQMLPELPHIRRGGIVLLPVEALQAWLREQAKAEPGRVEAVVDEVLQSVRESK